MNIISSGLPSTSYRALLCVHTSNKEFQATLANLEILQVYLQDVRPGLNIEIIVSGPDEVLEPLLCISKNLNVNRIDDVFALKPSFGVDKINEQQIDYVYIDPSVLQRTVAKKKSLPYLQGDLINLLREVVIFVKGNDVPWTFETEVFGMGWDNYYPFFDPSSTACSDFLFELIQNYPKLMTTVIREVIAGIVHKVSYISFTRDRLLYFEQQKRYARRRGWKRQEFSFERGYYLNNYYVLLQGFLDQVAVLTNDLLGLGINNQLDIELEKSEFKKKSRIILPELYALFVSNRTKEWIAALKPSRHYISHRGTIVLTKLLQDPGNIPSDTELEQEFIGTDDWVSAQRLLPPKMAEEYKKMVLQLKRIEKHKILVDDISVITTYDGNRAIYAPMKAVDWHYENLNYFWEEYIKIIKGFLTK